MLPTRLTLWVLLAAAFLGFAPLDAAAVTQCPNNPYKCSQAQAREDALRQAREAAAKYCIAPNYAGGKPDVYLNFHNSLSVGYYAARFMCWRADGSPTNSWDYRDIEHAHYWNDCLNRAPVEEANQPTGALRCVAGCEHAYAQGSPLPNGIFFSKGTATGKACKPEEYQCPAGYVPGGSGHTSLNSQNCIPNEPPDCPEGQTKVNGVCKRTEQCPAGMVQDANGACVPKAEECPSGQAKGPDGSCVDDGKCPAGQVRGQDGSCKKDGDGDGEPDAGEDDGKFSGGDDCKQPPQCSGDNILCGQARIQWRIDCNTRRNRSVSGGACNAAPICTGEKCDAVEYSQMLFQWRTACALENLAINGAPPGQGGGTAAGGETCDTRPTCSGDSQQCTQLVQQWKTRCEAAERRTQLSVEASGLDTSNGSAGHESDSIWGADVSETFRPDTGGLGWGASCPAPPQIFGKTLDLAGMCNLMHMLGAIILAVAFAHAMYILMGD